MKELLRYIRIFKVQIRNNFVREAIYRTNFFTTVTVDLIWVALEFALFSVIYSNVPVLAGWTKHQVYFFLGIFFSSDALFTIIFQRNFWQFSDLVNKGGFDIVLTKPANPLFLALTRWISTTAIFNFIFGLIIAAHYASMAGFAGGWRWLLVAGWLVIGVLSAVLLRLGFSLWMFWTERSWAINRLYYQFFTFATKPDQIYPPMIRYAILSFLPFGFIGSVPARALLHGLSVLEYLWIAIVLLVFGIFDWALWRAGLRRYQSVSS
jgi:ABC-2 type transport system permease protein